MDFPCAANSCIVFTVLLLIMAASCAHDEPHAPQLTAISGVGQFYLGVSLVNYTSALIPVETSEEFRRELPSFTEGEGVFLAQEGGFLKKEGEYPTRKRMDHNQLNRKEYLLHVHHVC